MSLRGEAGVGGLAGLVRREGDSPPKCRCECLLESRLYKLFPNYKRSTYEENMKIHVLCLRSSYVSQCRFYGFRPTVLHYRMLDSYIPRTTN